MKVEVLCYLFVVWLNKLLDIGKQTVSKERSGANALICVLLTASRVVAEFAVGRCSLPGGVRGLRSSLGRNKRSETARRVIGSTSVSTRRVEVRKSGLGQHTKSRSAHGVSVSTRRISQLTEYRSVHRISVSTTSIIQHTKLSVSTRGVNQHTECR